MAIKPTTTGSVIAKGAKKARGQKQAAAAVKTLNTGGRQFQELSDNETDSLLKSARTEKVAGTDKTVLKQAKDDSGHKVTNWSAINKKLDKTLAKKKFQEAPAKAGMEPLFSNATMDDKKTGALRTAIANWHGSKAGSGQREIQRTAVHRLLREGSHNLETSVKIPCAVPKCNGHGVLHPTKGDNVKSSDDTSYRCSAHVNDYKTKDVWDQLGENESRKAAGQVARNAKSDAKKKVNAATISTTLPVN